MQLDNVATDGEAGEFDNVRSNVENVNGGSGADTLTRDATEGRLTGCETVSVGVAVGTIAIRPRGGRIEADGVARVVRRATRITRRGTLVTARLAVRIDASMAGERLGLEVEATDRTGRRQLERGAGTIRVAR